MAMREFLTGATRDEAERKNDYEGFISPLVTKRFGDYMTHHRVQVDGKLRASDNWQLGIPLDAYIKSLTRHVEDLKLHHDGFGSEATDGDIESVCCAIMFNIQGYLFETLKGKRKARTGEPGAVIKYDPTLPLSLKQREQLGEPLP